MNRMIFPIVLLVLAVGCMVYVGWRLWWVLPTGKVLKWAAVSVYALCAACMFSEFFLLDRLPMRAATVVYEVGNSWLIIFLYALMLLLVLEVGRWIRLLPRDFLNHSVAGTLTLVAVLVPVFVYGALHYHHKYREEIRLTTDKPLARRLKIVMASDLHLGYHNRRAELARWIDMMNAEQPDLILIAGDIIDISTRPLLEGNYATEFQRLTAPVYACLGNHEYFSGDAKAAQFYEQAGIRLLRDSVASIAGIRIVGRDDATNIRRKPLSHLTSPSPQFTILIDHQPHHLEEAELAGIDFQFSGHTHHGQIWPGNWITEAVYECAYGSHQRGSTHYYVSSGMGIWGGKFRIGTRSEYVVLWIEN